MFISVEEFLLGESDMRDLRELATAQESFSRYGNSQALMTLLQRRGVLMSSAALSLEADGVEVAADANAEAAHSGFAEKLKNWGAKALEKITNFGKYLFEKVSGFVHGVRERIGASVIKDTVKVRPVASAAAGVGILASVAGIIRTIGGLLSKLFTSSDALEDVVHQSAEAINHAKTSEGVFTATVNRFRLKVGFTPNKAKVAKEAAKAGGWTKNALNRMTESFGSGSHGLWDVLQGFGRAVKNVLLTGGRWAKTGVKTAMNFGDKHVAKGLDYTAKVGRAGGIKGFIFGTVNILVITYLVNSVLKLMRYALNTASDIVRNTVDALCGPAVADTK